jgi:hypothetical protein
MANIPLAQIPNAPQAGSTAVALPVGAIRAPRVEQMPVVSFAAFDGGGRGMQALGQSMARANAVTTDFAEQMARANDEMNFAAADRLLTENVAAFEVESSRLPESEHVTLWQEKYLPKVQEQVSGMGLTPVGRARLDAWMVQKGSETSAAVYTSANKRLIERGRMEIQNYVERANNEGRYEDAMGGIARGVSAGLFSQEEGGKLENDLVEKRKVDTLTQAIQQNPALWRKELRQYQAEGKNPHNLRPEQVLQFRRMAESTHGQLVQDLGNEMLTRLETQSPAITNEQIEEFFTRPDVQAPREVIQSFKKYRSLAYAQTPEGQAEKADKYGKLWGQIFGYNAEGDLNSKDPEKTMTEYYSLLAQVNATAPEGERKPFMDKLNEMVSNAREGKRSRRDEIAKGLVDKVEKFAEWGQLGDDGGWRVMKKDGKTERVPKDPQKYLNVQQKKIEAINAVREMLRTNPDLTEGQAMERFKGIMDDKLEAGSLFQKEVDDRGFFGTIGAWFGAMDAGESKSRNEGMWHVGDGKAVGKVTSYNWKGDPYSDSNSRNLIGAWNNRLTESSLAVSPDVEARFKQAGIGEGDAVELTLADGTTVVRTWDDRTMQDEQARRKFGKPLRGRFDFHHPYDGPFEKDGMAVVSFRKAPTA